MSCNLSYKNISKDSVTLGYSCDTLESVLNESANLIEDLREYCIKTSKDVDSKIFITPFDDEYVFEIKISKEIET